MKRTYLPSRLFLPRRWMPSGAAMFRTSGPLTFANSKVDVGHALRHNRDYAPATAAAAAAAARDTRLTPNLSLWISALPMRGRIDKSPLPRTIVTIRRLIIGSRTSVADARRLSLRSIKQNSHCFVHGTKTRSPHESSKKKIWPTVSRNQSKPDRFELSKFEMSINYHHCINISLSCLAYLGLNFVI